MQPSSTCLTAIQNWEGCRLLVYNDIAGFSTIGYGHKLATGESYPNGITQDQADSLFAQDINVVETALGRLVTVPLTQGQVDALTSFVFNLGEGRLASSTLLKDLNAGDYNDAGEQILLWDHSGGQVVPALKARREQEYEWWNS